MKDLTELRDLDKVSDLLRRHIVEVLECKLFLPFYTTKDFFWNTVRRGK